MKITILIILYVLACIYVVWQLHYWFRQADRDREPITTIQTIVVSLFCLIPVLAAFLGESRLQAVLQSIGNLWMGMYGIVGILLLLGHILQRIKRNPSVRVARTYLFAVGMLSISFVLYGFYHAQDIRYHYYQVELRTSGAELIDEGFKVPAKTEVEAGADNKQLLRLSFLSDLHMGVNSRATTVRHMVNLSNAVKPDYVIGGGDYLTSSITGLFEPAKYSKELRELLPSGKVLMAYGNHDVIEPLFCGFALDSPKEAIRTREIDRFFEDSGFRMLQDEVLNLENQAIMVFRQDKSKAGDGINNRKSIQELLAGERQDLPIIVVEHEPSKLESELSNRDIDLVLSGHTHNGQIFPGNLLLKLSRDNSYGASQIGSMLSIVSAGTGYFGPPIRIGTNSEIVIIDLIIG